MNKIMKISGYILFSASLWSMFLITVLSNSENSSSVDQSSEYPNAADTERYKGDWTGTAQYLFRCRMQERGNSWYQIEIYAKWQNYGFISDVFDITNAPRGIYGANTRYLGDYCAIRSDTYLANVPGSISFTQYIINYGQGDVGIGVSGSYWVNLWTSRSLTNIVYIANSEQGFLYWADQHGSGSHSNYCCSYSTFSSWPA